MSFYCFSQNNSGGEYHYDREAGLSKYVIIEAQSKDEALLKADSTGIYFDGMEHGVDCECCGDRWGEWIYATEEPGVYSSGDLVYLESRSLFMYESAFGGWMKEFEGFVHYLDGTIVPIIETIKPNLKKLKG